MNWELLDELPNGWIIDKTVGSPASGYIFCTNGKSVINGQKRALLKVSDNTEQFQKTESNIPRDTQPFIKKDIDPPYIFPSKSVNELARKKFQEQLLKEIMFDMMVCEIEGWDKKEYLFEIKNLIGSINTN